MLDLPHDIHLHINFLIKNSILHKTSLLKLLCSIRDAIKLVCDLVDHGKSALANVADLVILVTALPFSYASTNGWHKICI